jgi:hypothetical protein
MRASRRPVLPILVLGALAAAAPPATASRSAPARDDAPAAARAGARPSPVGIVRLEDPGSVLGTRRVPRSPEPGGTVHDGDNFVIRCQVDGARKDGRFGASRIWDQVQLATGEVAYLPDALTQTATKETLVAPYCGPPAPGRVGGTQGQCFDDAPIRLARAPRSHAAFLRQAGPHAKRSFRATRVPASVTLAQAILESGWGRYHADANNYFGVKAERLPGADVAFLWGRNALGCVHQPTNESEDGTDVRTVAQFRLYRTMRGSFVDHGLFLRENPRYARAFRYSRSPRRFARALQRAGYATDPGYSTKLVQLIRENRLSRWD